MKDRIFWFKNYLFRRYAFNKYKEALHYEHLSVEELKALNWEKRKNIVEYAYFHTPFYKKYYDSRGFHPSQIYSDKDWEKVPILEKEFVRENPEALKSDEFDWNSLSPSTTGGSTGTPLIVYKEKKIPFEVMGWRALNWWGLDPSDNVGILHRRTPTSFVGNLKNRLLWWPTQRAYLNATKISNKNIIDFIKEIKRRKIVWIQGYCSALEQVSDFICDNNIYIPNVKMVWSTSSPLSKTVRVKIETAFHCQVMDQYGCCELWNIAMQKPNEPYLTICSDFVHVDVVRDDGSVCGKEEYGDILITDLNTFGFPLIKYRLGDKGSISLTALESHDRFPKLNFVKGRITDSIYLQNNDRIDGAYLTTICDKYPEIIDSFQIYQKLDFSVQLKLVLKKDVSPENPSIQNIINRLREKLGDSIPFSYIILDEIKGDRGKKRYIISEIALERQKH